jgi:hypothetical protein
MGNVSLFEDISERLNENAVDAVALREKPASIKHLADGPGARAPRLRPDVQTLWKEFEDVVQALNSCNTRKLPTNKRKWGKSLVDNAVESGWLIVRLREVMARLIRAYPFGHPDRIILKRGLRQI